MDCQNEHRDQCFAEGVVFISGDGTLHYSEGLHTHTLTMAQLPSHCSGYEGAGPQQTDAPQAFPDCSEAIKDLVQMVLGEEKGRDVDRAISALHGQHTRNGRPSRFMQEVE